MNVANVRVTLVDDGGRTDVAVAAGTPVRALLEARTGAAVPDDVRVSTTTGAPAPLNSLIGQDLGSGTVLLVGGRVTGRHAADRLAIRSASRPVRPALDAAAVVLVACLLLALGWYSALTVGEARLPLPARAGAAGLAAALLAARAILANNRLTPVQEASTILPLPLLGAATGALLVSADALEPVATTTLLSAWGAGAASLALWLRLRSACAATGALAWTTVAALATAILVLDVPRTSVVVISLALGALFITLVPAVSLSSVPDQQLLDLSEQRAGSRGVRVPTVEPPARVTGARISRTLDQAER